MSRIVLPGEPLVDGPTTLRPWRDDDVQALVAACQDPEIARWTTVPRPYRESDARSFLLYRYAAHESGAAALWAIVDSGSGQLVGSIGLVRIEWKHLRAEVGYWIAREARGQGHATRAVKLVSGWAFHELELERIELHAATGNHASQAVARGAGFTAEAVLRSQMLAKDGRLDIIVFGLLRDDAPR